MSHPDIQNLFETQLQEWDLARENFFKLEQVQTKEWILDGQLIRLQFNPGRIRSTAADVRPEAVQERPCFLCEANRPPQQKGLPMGDFTLLVNPFPVFPKHFTLAAGHLPQAIRGRFRSLLDLAAELDDCVVFYNGPRCGASAPDHMHFQAGSSERLPLVAEIDQWRNEHVRPLLKDASIFAGELTGLLQTGWLLEGPDPERLDSLFNVLLECMEENQEQEPLLNILGWFGSGVWHCLVLPRKAHRPACYFLPEPDRLMVSPASVEMGGLLVLARSEDFERITQDDVRKVFADVCADAKDVTRWSERFVNALKEPSIEVGIVSASVLPFHFPHPFRIQDGSVLTGLHEATCSNGRIVFEGKTYEQLEFEPAEAGEANWFELPNVTIGVGFHWERTEKQAFEGRLRLLVDGDKLVAVNVVPLESYLTSVISSEMSAHASPALLQAHAVISRSWLLAQMHQKGKNRQQNPGFVETETERIRWYDREDHLLFDVCADDHCQRYQGITRASTPQVREAIAATRGRVLLSEGECCDARFSKSCGGAMETFENCWENTPKPYLKGLPDWRENASQALPDLRNEDAARAWILGSPEAFCNTSDQSILRQVLNNYDQETTDFYRWTVRYSTGELSRLVRERSGIDFGEIQDLIPVERGCSGRLTKLCIVGVKRSMVIGKELEIRRTLAPTHLYSSAFIVEKTTDGFVLHGAGWGHGVGLCQIGAAVMGERGYDYQAILAHYYPNTELKTLYL